jgi:SAM-dependent methyltransferase
MEQLRELLENTIDASLVQMILSGKQKGADVTPESKRGDAGKYKIRPIQLKKESGFQISAFCGKQVFHENVNRQQLIEQCLVIMETMQQMQIERLEDTVTVLISKKGKITVKRKAVTPRKAPQLSHNREKKYILEEGRPVPFLVDLGVMTPQGKVVHAKYDKYRQINRFLEFVEDTLPVLAGKKEIHIIDFGCGKSYLTFALYYFLKELRGFEPVISGLDLKQEVIEHCNQLSQKYGYEGLQFFVGDIADYNRESEVDMVVTLHACDTATDYALAKAVSWNAKVILSVPCCQHEVNSQIQNELLSPILSYGILKERLSAIFTDGIRASLLEQSGYETQILEFIDMEHTPKNLLIRGVKKKNKTADYTKIDAVLKEFSLQPTLNTLLRQ